MTSLPPGRPTLGARLLLGLFLAALAYFGLYRDWLGLRALLVAQIIFVSLLAFAMSRLPALRRDGRPPRVAYLVSTLAGLLAGLGFGLVSSSPLSIGPVFNGALIGFFWIWLGQFLREPFGSTPWPPYPKD